MAKLATLAAILGVLLVMSHAVAANRATITTVNIDEPENQRRCGGSCYEQVEMLDHCEQLFEDVIQGGSRYGYGGYGGGRYGGGYDQCSGQQLRQSRHFEPCCNELRRMDDECRCQGLREVIREQMGGYGGRGSQDEVRRCARNLQNMCGLGQSCYNEAMLNEAVKA
ncbi:2S seed storage albumin protein-like [Rhodamnia argentea]|uniref:2S seed storage albumin protein-like n=1 Tax=Rhodamnia argentea TaxID=178133 RepID=A0ABM3H183_9MYRT|nr:2S seed storage albumin protein-like [Rhodamnia argentea]